MDDRLLHQDPTKESAWKSFLKIKKNGEGKGTKESINDYKLVEAITRIA